MGLVARKNQAWAVEIEDTEGVYKAPVASASFVQTLADGAEMNRSKETIERNIFSGSLGQTSPRTGQFSASGALPVEARAGAAEGAAPEFDKLMRSGLGARRQLLAAVVSGEDHTEAIIKVTDSSVFAVNDIVLVKEPGKFHVSPIKRVAVGEIELLIPAADPFSDAVEIAKHTTYGVADSGHPSLSVSRYLEGSILQQTVGARVSSIAIENFSTGQIPSINFGFEGLNFNQSLAAPPHAPAYIATLPPIMLDGRVFMDGVSLDVNELTLQVDLTLGFQTSINAPNGRKSGRQTQRAISGTFNPYMESDSMANFERFKQNSSFSIFAYGKLPSAVPGEFSAVVAIYITNAQITELGEADADGLLQDSISFSANRGPAGDKPELFISFI